MWGHFSKGELAFCRGGALGFVVVQFGDCIHHDLLEYFILLRKPNFPVPSNLPLQSPWFGGVPILQGDLRRRGGSHGAGGVGGQRAVLALGARGR